jgi:hypothetical protein
MVRRRFVLLVALIAPACKEGTGSTPTIVAPSDSTAKAPRASPAPSPTPAPTASTSALAGFPPLTDACSTDADCASTNFGPDCCFRCETSVGDKPWVAKVDAYCLGRMKAGESTSCGASTPCSRESATPSPMLAYVNANPKCTAGHCLKPH